MGINQIERIIQRCGEDFGADPRMMLTRNSSPAIAEARIVAVYLMRKALNPQKIGALFGRSVTSYKANCVGSVQRRSKVDQKYYKKVLALSYEFGVEWL